MNRKRLRLQFLIPVAAAGLVLAACSGDDEEPDAEDAGQDEAADSSDDEEDGGTTSAGEFPREQTLYTSGTEWGTYSNWNPIAGGGEATGAQGLMYEPLYLFDPNTAELQPWLADSGEWVGENEYELTLREGLTWHDGEPLTAEDVVFTLDLRQYGDVPYSPMDEWVDTAEAVDDLTMRVTFSDPRRAEWENFLYSEFIVPEHLWAEKAAEGITEEPGTDVLVGSGSYKYNTHTEERSVLERNDDWWGIEALGMEMAPQYIIDFKNQSNEVVIPQLQQGELDLSNNFLPVDVVANNDQIDAYRDEPPYMIAWNTAYLLPNHDRPPMDDAAFRRALAFSINVDEIVSSAYAGLVSAADPTGLLPTWTEQGMVDEDVVAEHGFSYDAEQAASILADAGYEDGDGDGFVETPDGEPIELTLVVPAGWTDWNIAAEIIAENAQAAGINVVTDFPESATVDEMRNQGEFDLVVNNWTELQNSPWDNYQYLFELPVQEIQSAKNFHRYENEAAWQLTQDLGRLSVGNPETEDEFGDIMSQLQEISLTELPAIPLWYNGLWAQWNTTYWTNWPKAPDGPAPGTWNHAWEKGGILMLAQLEPAQ